MGRWCAPLQPAIAPSVADQRLLLEQLGTVPGDTDLDGVVGFSDFLALQSRFGDGANRDFWAAGDFDCSGRVEFADFLLLAANFGEEAAASTEAIPEPAGLLLTLIGAILVMNSGRSQRRR